MGSEMCIRDRQKAAGSSLYGDVDKDEVFDSQSYDEIFHDPYTPLAASEEKAALLNQWGR